VAESADSAGGLFGLGTHSTVFGPITCTAAAASDADELVAGNALIDAATLTVQWHAQLTLLSRPASMF
jgi:hypothetical protein